MGQDSKEILMQQLKKLTNAKVDSFRFFDELSKLLQEANLNGIETYPLKGRQDISYKGKNLIVLEESSSTEEEKQSLLLCHIPTILQYSDAGGNPLIADIETAAYTASASIMLAMKHFNNGDGSIIKQLDGINNKCNVRLTTEILDSHSTTDNDSQSIQSILTAILSRNPNSISTPQPCALLGAQSSAISGTLASISSRHELPQVSLSEMFLNLNNSFSTLAAIHPDVAGYAAMSASYLHDFLRISTCGLIVADNLQGLTFEKSILESKAGKNMDFISVKYPSVVNKEDGEYIEQNIRDVLMELKESGVRYFVISFDAAAESFKLIMKRIYDIGLLGAGYFWLISGTARTAPFLLSEELVLETESDFAKALVGNGIIYCQGGLPGIGEIYDKFLEQWYNIASDPQAMEYFNAKQPRNLEESPISSSFFLKEPHQIATFSYDAAVGLGMAACDASSKDGNSFEFQSHYQNLISDNFQGVSGRIEFNISSPTAAAIRTSISSYFVIVNLVLKSINSTHSTFQNSPIPFYYDTQSQSQLTWQRYGSYQFVYPDGSIFQPAEALMQSGGRNNEQNSKNAATITVTILLLIMAFIIVGLVHRLKKKQIDSTWVVDSSELIFHDPPVILGRGTFGLVLLAEYRGTSVAVKRILPPREKSIPSTIPISSPSVPSFGSFGSAAKSTKSENVAPVRSKLRKSISISNLPIAQSNLVRVSGGEDGEQPQARRISYILDTFSFQDEDLDSVDNHLEAGMNSIVGLNSLASADASFMSSGGVGSGGASVKSSISRLFKSKSLAERCKFSTVRQDFINEMRLLSKLRHPCITTVMGAVIHDTNPLLIMEYMDYGSLYDLLHNETMAIEGDFVLPILRDISQGLHFLHAAQPTIIHGDLKAANVLVDIKLRAKVADFGLSQKKKLSTGTPLWMAPELLRGTCQNTPASDVYSFGITLYEVYSRKDPYEGEDDLKKILTEICDPHVNRRPQTPKNMPLVMSSLMTKCLSTEVDARPSFGEIAKQLKRLDEKNIEPKKSVIQNHKEDNDKDNNKLLYEMLPKHIADALREGRKIEPESHDCVTIFFSDIVGFTKISSDISPLKISNMLDRLYQRMDALADKHDIFKVETIGDAWMGVTNLIKHQPDHALRIAKFSIDAIDAASETPIDEEDLSLGNVHIRVGFHSGPVVSNVIGSRNPRFSLFGDTVNTASRMESNSEPGRIHCSDAAAELLLPHEDDVIMVSIRGTIPIKGKGDMTTFWVHDRAKKRNSSLKLQNDYQ